MGESRKSQASNDNRNINHESAFLTHSSGYELKDVPKTQTSKSQELGIKSKFAGDIGDLSQKATAADIQVADAKKKEQENNRQNTDG
eukprot:scaffold222452_cov39-Prasinocladus_malaysianus.AAC.1